VSASADRRRGISRDDWSLPRWPKVSAGDRRWHGMWPPAYGLYPLDRLAHREASLRRLASLARRGKPVLIFPQGTHARPADERRLVRTLDSNARAFLSDRYRPLDHDEILEQVLPALGEFDLDWSQSSLEVTEQRLYMKLVNPQVEADVEVGDPVQAGVLVTNSEIGMGSFSVVPLVFRLAADE